MTQITILTIGSRGDVQPFCALALGLIAKGYSVKLAASTNFADWADQLGIPFAPIAGNFQQLLQTPEGIALLEGDRNASPFDDDLCWQQMSDGWHACQGSDLLIFAPLAAWGYHLAEALEIPAILATQIPIAATRAYPFLKFADLPKRWPVSQLNVSTYHLLEFLSWQQNRQMINQFRQEILQLKPIDRLGARYRRNPPTHLAPLPILNNFSASVSPPPSDLQAHIHQVGYWFLDTDAQFVPPQPLQDFLQAGSRPLYIGFGSMVARNADSLFAKVLTALKTTQQRAILCSGWSSLTAANVPDSVYVTKAVPHDWLLPQVTAAIHHGGAGTTAAVLRAGIPSIVVPFFADQPAWGKRLEQLGVAAAPIPYLELTAEALADRIRSVVNNRAMKHQAQQLSIDIQAEDGIAEAIDVIERYLSSLA